MESLTVNAQNQYRTRLVQIPSKFARKKVNGTSYHGSYITTSYETLSKVFGEGLEGRDKTTVEYIITDTKTGIVCTIYDWKELISPRVNKTGIYEFYIGTHTVAESELMQRLIIIEMERFHKDEQYEKDLNILEEKLSH